MQDNYLSLTHVRLRQYRSIATADVDLGRLTFMVGPNGSGKSNFLDAVRLLSESLQTSLEQALHHRGGIGEVRRKSTGHPTRFSIDLAFEGPRYRGDYGIQVAAVRGGGFRVTREQLSVWSGRSGAGRTGRPDAGFRVADGVLTESTESGMPAADGQRLLLADARGVAAFRPVLDGLAAMSVVSLSPQAMRLPQLPDPGASLHRDGSNVPGVLYRLGRSRQGREDKVRIESYLRQIVPGVHGVSRSRVGDRETVEFVQDVPGAKKPWRFKAPSVSDGTLRALGVLTALFTGPGSTLAVEEPEAALHPAATGVLLEALRDACAHRQIIVTSHSPDLLDNEDIRHSEVLAVRSVGGQTTIGALDEPAAFALRAQLHTPGELLRTGQLHPQRPGSDALRTT